MRKLSIGKDEGKKLWLSAKKLLVWGLEFTV